MATTLLKIVLPKYARNRIHKQFTSYLLAPLMNINTSETTWNDGLAERMASYSKNMIYFQFLDNPPRQFLLIFLQPMQGVTLLLNQ